MTSLSNTSNTTAYKGNDRILFGFILGLLSFWLFGMTMLNVNVVMNQDLGLPNSSLNLAVSITSLFSGMTVVIFGGLADKIGRVKITRLGFIFAIIGAALVAATPGKCGLTLPVLLTGRVLQGLSAACIMPSTLALLREYWDEKGRQRAVSLWSMGTWGGTSFAALVGGAMADNLGWRWIFIVSTVLSLLGLYLIRDIPESKAEQKGKAGLDYLGMVLFMFFIVTLQLFVSKGSEWGWTSMKSLIMAGISIVFLIIFILFEQKRKESPFIDFRLFRNKTFTGATISNFILNGTSGVLIVTLMLMQQGGGISADTTGLLTIGYGVVILLFIRVGERLLRKFGPRKPMIWGCLILLLSIACMLPTNIMTKTYMVLMSIGYIFFGLGLAFYATPSTDAALSNLPLSQTASGSGIYKMASSLGNGFGIAISSAIYSGIVINGRPFTALDTLFIGRQDNLDFRHGAMMALLFNFVMIVIAIITIRATVEGKTKQE
ncbi:MAG: MFS transporter [Bacteroidota bacterium]|jgi:DHA2 family multidrug resistance protein-like MFS transporter|nr:MFS transporter [Bacteroidota bacterium]